MTKNTIRLRSEVNQKDVYRCQKVGPERVITLVKRKRLQPLGLSSRQSGQTAQRKRERLETCELSMFSGVAAGA
jgi:hypothetical protein